jgi:hypothetical protein
MAHYFQSGEEAVADGAGMPNPPWDHTQSDETPESRGIVRADGDCIKGTKAIEFSSTDTATDDLYNEVNYDTIPTTGNAGPYYFGYFFKAIRVGGVSIWPDTDGNAEGFDKTVDILGEDWRWCINTGIRGQDGAANTYSLFITQPGIGQSANPDIILFNPSIMEYDSFWQNTNGYGRGNSGSIHPDPFYAMAYDRWYAVVLKLTLSGGSSGELGLWINGTKVMEYTGIRTTFDGTLDHRSLWHWMGTYNQPSGPYPLHKRRIDAVIYTDELAHLQTNGYFADPEAAESGTLALFVN